MPRMAQPRLVLSKWLRNHGVSLFYRTTEGASRKRFVAANGHLTVGEASRVLGAYDMKLYRMIEARELRTVKIRGVRMVPMSEARRLRSLWKRRKAA